MSQNVSSTCLFVILSSITSLHFIPNILLIFLRLNTSNFLMSTLVSAQLSLPHKSKLIGIALYIKNFDLKSTSFASQKNSVLPYFG